MHSSIHLCFRTFIHPSIQPSSQLNIYSHIQQSIGLCMQPSTQPSFPILVSNCLFISLTLASCIPIFINFYTINFHTESPYNCHFLKQNDVQLPVHVKISKIKTNAVLCKAVPWSSGVPHLQASITPLNQHRVGKSHVLTYRHVLWFFAFFFLNVGSGLHRFGLLIKSVGLCTHCRCRTSS
jgi:hypothetical protein